MLRLGKFTGKIYADEEISKMQECGVCISENESDLTLARLRILNSIDCSRCVPGNNCCPEKNKKYGE